MAARFNEIEILKKAYELRTKLKLFSETDAIRIFHGPGEGGNLLHTVSIEKFGQNYWITEWEDPKYKRIDLNVIESFLKSIDAKSAVH